MFIQSITEQESEVQAKISPIGIKIGATLYKDRGYGRPAICGNTYDMRAILKSNGARWNTEDRAWNFETFAARDAAALACVTK